MKTRFLHIPLFIIGMSLTLSGCLSDDTMTGSGESSSGDAYKEPVPSDDEVAQATFTALNLDYPGLEAVKAHVEAEAWGKASVELLNYYRNRVDINNPSVDLINTTASATEQSYARYALKENDYRFYVNGYFEDPEGTKPYSYKTTDGAIDWTYCPTDEQEQRGQIHRHQWFIPQAKTYRMLGEENLLKNWMEVYDDWWAQNPKPERYDEQTGQDDRSIIGWLPLSVAARVIDQCNLLEYYKWADAFTPVYLTKFLGRMSEQVEFIKNNYWADSNHRISQAQAVTIAGILFPEMKQAPEWVTNGSTVLNEEIVKQYYSDGWLKDNDLHYHIGSIESFRIAMHMAVVNHQEGRFNADYVAAIRKMVEVEKYMLYPNYGIFNGGADVNHSTPNFGDTRPSSWTRNVLLRQMRNFRDLFPDDQELKWLASQGQEGQVPAAGIKCFPEGGHYAIRNGWTKDATMMVLVNAIVTPSEKWHRQWDNNNFELYVNGRQFFPDSGCFTYGGDSQSNADRRKYAATAAHTTLTLGEANVTSCRGVCLKAEQGAQNDLLVLENPSYAGLTHRRAVFFVDHKFFVIVDEGYGDAAGTVNLNFHLAQGSDTEVVFDPTSNGAYTAFADKNNIVVRTFSSQTLTSSAKTGFVSIKEGVTADRKAYKVDLAKTADMPAARFITVISPAQDATAVTLDATFVNPDFDASGASVKVTIDGKAYNLSYTL